MPSPAAGRRVRRRCRPESDAIGYVAERFDGGMADLNGAQVLDIAQQGIWTLILVSAPMMIAGLVVGVVIALFQALTQIQEQTLVFVPKILAIFITLLVALPFMGATMGDFMNRIVDLIIHP